MSLHIGYYVHHHGMGHLTRALAIAEHISAPLTILGSDLVGKCGDAAYIELPDDRDCLEPEPGDLYADNFPQALHYAPLRCDGIRQRSAVLTGWIASRRPDLLVVDVSVEIAMLARLASTPVLYMRLAGVRSDAAHLDAFRGARALAAPFHQLLDDPQTPGWVIEKTRYLPGLAAAMPELMPQAGTVLIVLGSGGTAIDGGQIAAAAAATPQLRWRVIGPVPPVSDPPANLRCLGWVADAATEIAKAEIVVGAAGDGVVNAVIAAGRPFICLPQPRPYDEQNSKARRLAAIGAAITLDGWPAPEAWPGLIEKARALQPAAFRDLHDPMGLQQAAAFITALASRQ